MGEGKVKMKITIKDFQLVAICPNCGERVYIGRGTWQAGGSIICPKCKTTFWPTFTVLEFVGQKMPKSPAWKGWRLESKNKM